MIKAIRRKLFYIIIFFLVGMLNIYAEETITVVFENTFFSTKTSSLLEGSYEATANICSDSTILWSEKLPGTVTFNQGVFNITLGKQKDLPQEIFNNPTLNLLLEIPNDSASFSILSLPYSIQAEVAEKANVGFAQRIVGVFSSPMKIDNDLSVGLDDSDYKDKSKRFYVDYKNQRVSLGVAEPQSNLDMKGYVNISTYNSQVKYLLNERDLLETFVWNKQAEPYSKNIYYKTDDKPTLVGINAIPTINKLATLTIVGTANADVFLKNYQPLYQSLYWKEPDPSPSGNIYSTDLIGIGIQNPTVMLEVRNSVKLGTTEIGRLGTLRWSETSGFQGFKDGKWVDMISITGVGDANRIAGWSQTTHVNSLQQINWRQESSRLGINVENPKAQLDIQNNSLYEPSLVAVAGENGTENTVIHIDKDGIVGIGTSFPGEDWPEEEYSYPLLMDVNGTIEARDLHANQESVLDSFGDGIWKKKSDRSIHYIKGHVGIGRPDPGRINFKGPNPNYLSQEIGNTLEIAAPNIYPGEPTVDPTVTFATYDENNVLLHNYSMGVDADEPEIFRIEKSAKLGTESPLFIAYKQRLGIGLERPLVNLHVKGNLGTLMTGEFEAATGNVVTGPGTRFVWMPSQSAFRVGRVTEGSSLGENIWNWENVGKGSISMGADLLASGKFSTTLGGEENVAEGAYTAILGGSENRASGDFSLALGKKAKTYHHGTFVWADGQQGDEFKTNVENQFVIYASGGMGIGTANTGISDTDKRFGLIIATNNFTDKDTTNLLKAVGPIYDPTNIFVITTEGRINLGTENVGVNLTEEEAGKLNVFNGKFGIGTTSPIADLEVVSSPDTQLAFLSAGIEDASTSPAIVVTSSSNVGIGMYPETEFSSEDTTVILKTTGFLQIASGDIAATNFIFPDGQKIATGGPVIVWSWLDPIVPASFAEISGISTNAQAQQNIWNQLNSNEYLDDNGGVTAKFDPDNMDQIFIDLAGQYGIEAIEIHSILKRTYIAQGEKQAPVTPNIAFVSGNVGIGTISPNSLLELSNIGSQRSLSPLITFDMNGNDLFSIGVNQGEPTVFRIESGGSKDFGQLSPPITVSGNFVGIKTKQPKGNMHIVGKTILKDPVRINTGNISMAISAPTVNVNKLYIKEDDNTAGGVKWEQQSSPNVGYKIWYSNVVDENTFNFIGIGTKEPESHLDVKGTIKVQTSNEDKPSIKVQKKLYIKDTLSLEELRFRDKVAGDTPKLFVDDNKLLLAGAETVNVSNIFSAGQGPGGNLAIWLPEETRHTKLGNSYLYWDDTNSELELTSNITFSHFYSDQDHFTASNNIYIGSDIQQATSAFNTDEIRPFLSLASNISRGNSEYDARSYLAKLIQVQLPNIEAPTENVEIKGLAIEVYQPDDASLKNNSDATGLEVDVTDINIIPGNSQIGYKYAAIFKTGITANVGINKAPEVALDVSGTVSADRFVISERLSISTINVKHVSARLSDPALNVYSGNKVGIGTSEPQTELEIIGEGEEVIEATYVRTKGVESYDFSIQNGQLIVARKKVGMGISSPLAQWHLYKAIKKPADISSSQFSSQKIVVSNNVTSLAKDNISALEMKIKTEPNNKIGPFANDVERVVQGVNIDLSQMYTTQNTLVGLNLQTVSKNADNTTQNVAIFMGKVGIGNTKPEYPLVVNGTIHAHNMLDIVLGGDQHAAAFDHLNSRSSTANTYIGQDLYIIGNVYIATLNIPNEDLLMKYELDSYQKIIVPNLTIETANITMITNTTELDANKISANIGIFNGVGVNNADLSERLHINGTLLTNLLTGTLNIKAGALAINYDDLVVSIDGKVGMNTLNSDRKLTIRNVPNLPLFAESIFTDQDNQTWNSIRIQTRTASKNVVSGIKLTPHSGIESDSSCGILAVRTDDGPVTGSHMVFVTVPDGRSSDEYLRLTSEGNVGLGTTEPLSTLHVTDGAAIDKNLIATRSFYINNLKGIDSLSINTSLNIVSTFNSIDLAADKIEIKPIESINKLNGYGTVFISSSDNKLYYLTAVATDKVASGSFQEKFNLSAEIPTSSIPFYNSEYKLRGAKLSWITGNIGLDSLNALRLDNNTTIPSGDSFVQLENRFPSQNLYNTITAQKIINNFDKRTNNSDSVFTGVSINIGEINSLVAQDDTLVGLRVDLAKELSLDGGYHLDDGSLVEAEQYAAYFLANNETDSLAKTTGNVGIATSFNNTIFHPLADLHVSSNVEKQAGFQVDLIKSDLSVLTTLVVSANSYTGIGTSLPISKLTLQAADQSSANSVLNIIHNNASVLFARNDSNLGIGTTDPQSTLEVDSVISANSLDSNDLNSSVIEINTENEGFVVTINGNVGMGVLSPESQFHLKEILDDPSNNQDFSLELLDLIISGNQDINKNLTGLDIAINSIGNYSWFSGLSDEEKAYRATGLDVNLTQLAITTGNSLIGVYVDLPQDINATQYQEKLLKSAIFLGGNVGVGTTAPSYLLDVNGTIKAVDFRVEDSFVFSNVEVATFNRVVITSDATIDTLYVKNSTPSIEIKNEFYIQENLDTAIEWINPQKIFTAQDIFSQVVTLNNLRINTANAITASVNIDGTIRISKSVTFNVLSISEMSSEADIAFISPTLNVTEKLHFSEDSAAEKIFFSQTSTPSNTANYGMLFVSNLDNNIFYTNEATTINLGGRTLGTSGRIPFFDSVSNLNSNAYLEWKITSGNELVSNVIKVGTENVLSSLRNESLIGTDQFLAGEAFTENLIDINFAKRVDRVLSYKPTFAGVSINMSDSVVLTNVEKDAEKYVGLFVDVRELQDSYVSEGLGQTVHKGTKYAAIFLANGNETLLPEDQLTITPSYFSSCNVGVVTKTDEAYNLNAQLHIINKLDQNGMLVVSRFTSGNIQIVTRNALLVSANGQIAIGSHAPSAQVSISSYKETDLPLTVLSQNSNTLLAIGKDSFTGIGTNQPDSYLDIFNSNLDYKTLIVNVTSSNPTAVDHEGKVGIGTIEPSANLHVYFRPDRYNFTPTLYLFYWDTSLDGTPQPSDNTPLFVRQVKYWYRGKWTSYGWGRFPVDGAHQAATCSLYDEDVHAAVPYQIDNYLVAGRTDGRVFVTANVLAVSTQAQPNAMVVTQNGNISLGMQAFVSPSIPLQTEGFIYSGKPDSSLVSEIPGSRPANPEWVTGNYEIGDWVTSLGRTFICIVAHDSSSQGLDWEPKNYNDNYDPDYWEEVNITITDALPFGLLTKTDGGYGGFVNKIETAFQTWKERKKLDAPITAGSDYYVYGVKLYDAGQTVPAGTYYSDDMVNSEDDLTEVSDYRADTNLVIQWGNSSETDSINKDVIIFQSGRVAEAAEVMRITMPEKTAVNNGESFGETDFKKGRVGIGTTDPQATLAIRGEENSDPIFWVGLDNDPSVTIHDGIWQRDPSYTDSGATVNINGIDYVIYLDNHGKDFIIWTEISTSAQRYSYLDVAGTSTTNVEVAEADRSTYSFIGIAYDTPSEPENSLVIDANGNIGINTSTPNVLFQVNGTSNMQSIVMNPNGTRLTIEEPENRVSSYNLLLSSDESSTTNFVITSVVSEGQENAVGESIEVNIDKQDLNGNEGAGLVGLEVKMDGVLTFKPPGPDSNVSFNGIFVDVANLNTKDPSDIVISDGTPVGWNNRGIKYSGVFLGGNVGIGTSTPDATLHVLPLKSNGKVPDDFSSSIPIARFSNSETKDFLEIFCKGKQVAYEEVPTLAFTSKPGVSRIESKAIFEDLLKNGFLKVVTDNPILFDGVDVHTDYNSNLYPSKLIGKVVPNPAISINDTEWQEYVLPRFLRDPDDPASFMYITSITTQNVMRIVESHKAKGVVTFKSGSELLEGGDSGENFLYLTTGTNSFNSGDIESQIESEGDVEEIFIKTQNRVKDGSVGAVGIYVPTPSAALHVNGDIRIGSVTENTSVSQEGGIGKSIFFSGGSAFGVNNSDNNDEMWIARWNVKTVGRTERGLNELLINFGEDGYDPNSRFLVRTSSTDEFSYDLMNTPNFAVRCFGFRENDQQRISPQGMVGIATGNPLATLHVYGANPIPGIGQEKSPTHHLVIMEDNDQTMAGIAIRYTLPIGAGSNFISFLVPSTNEETEKVEQIGSIEGVGGDTDFGVRFVSSDADYAEYLQKLHKSEALEKGDIVGIFSGKITKNTAKAEQIMVISSAPIIVGNWPGKGKEGEYSPVAFLGQVPVKVKGPIMAGDYIVPSGLNDGVGKSLAASEVSPATVDSIMGVAWETSNEKGMKYIKTLIGFPSAISSLIKEISAIDKIKNEIEVLRTDNAKLSETYTKKLSDRQKQINRLKQKI